MKNKAKTITILTSVLAMAVGILMPSQVFAATSFDGNDYVTLTRNITNVSNPISDTLSYKIDPKEDYSTKVVNAPTSASIVFNNVTPGTNNTATSTTNVSFANTTFNAAGDFYFNITETSSSNTSVPVDSTVGHQVVASVRYVVDPSTGAPDPDKLVVKLIPKDSLTWASAAQRTSFKVSAKTTGDMADISHCFAYTLNIPTGNGVSTGDTFTATTTGAEGCTANPTSIAAGDNTTIYLKHNSIMTVGKNGTVTQMPIGSSFSVTLNQATSGYVASLNGTEMEAGTPISITGLVAETDPDFNTKNTANIDQHNDSPVPTGVITNVVIYTAIFGIGAAGLAYFGSKRVHSKNKV